MSAITAECCPPSARNAVRDGAEYALTGVALKTLGGEGSLSTITPYRLAQSWAMAVHRHPQQVDGILYMSRHLNDRQAVVVFDRAGVRLGAATYTPLPRARGVMEAVAGLRISFDYP